ncbi:MAG: UvrD-helicase domain-containing protein [Bacteroidales bacterium]|nr:UvrD-helicase domain-containing protein [Bacteroidales bacterium]
MMVIAGAGSGKTRVLTHRIAYLIANGVSPFHILALTFTNKAAEEMRNRIAQLLGDSNSHNVWMGTFHSIFSKILHIESSYLGFSPKFTIYDTDDAKNLLKSIVKEMNLDDKVYRPNMLLTAISNAKSNLISPEEYNGNHLLQRENHLKKVPDLGEIYTRYNQRLRRADAMDFDDLLFNMYLLLRDFPELLYKYQHKFQYILVDEYQDTNYVQYQIVRKLAALNENICVVGDDAQSIYAFRGANIQNILNFKEDYPDYNLYKLEQNYRSTQNILAAANDVIGHNSKQIPKSIWTANQQGDKIKVFETADDRAEAKAVAEEILRKKRDFGLNNNDFAILYRTNAQSRPLEEVFHLKGLPYRIYGGMSFYKRKEIKDMLAYYRLTANPNDDESLRRIINYPQRGIGLSTMEKVITAATQHGVSIWECICNPAKYNLQLSPAILKKLYDFTQKIQSYQALLPTHNAFELGKHIADTSGVTQELRAMEEEPERYQNLGELFNAMKAFVEKEPENPIDMETGEDKSSVFPSLDVFLNEVSLLTNSDEDEKDESDKIKLMTIHAAKGLEFPHVFVIGLEEQLFPSYMISSTSELEEERRLFYVAITRAKRFLSLSFAHSRFLFGNTSYHEPSRFLKEISAAYKETEQLLFEQPARPRQDFGQRPSFRSNPASFTSKPKIYTVSLNKTRPMPSANAQGAADVPKNLGEVLVDTAQMQAGMRVFHGKFGCGTLEEILETGSNGKVIVSFDRLGRKTILIAFAKLKPLL